MGNVNWLELSIVIVLFLLVTVLGFMAARWRRGETLMHLDEWGLGGRSFGSWITWFLLGGDLYTAYTFVAVPALLFVVLGVGTTTLVYRMTRRSPEERAAAERAIARDAGTRDSDVGTRER